MYELDHDLAFLLENKHIESEKGPVASNDAQRPENNPINDL